MSGADGLFHGGVPGLRPGDLLTGGMERRVHDGCPFCAARAEGRTLTVDGSPVDPPSAEPDRVYFTSDRAYARLYASLYGYGDLYRVEPVGEPRESDEDHFPAWTAEQVRVVSVVERAVRLTWSQRRALMRRWEAADRTALQAVAS